MRLIRFAAMASMLATQVCFAAPRSVDVEQFDIAGVKLGMGRNAAISAISEKLGIDKRSVVFDKFPSMNPITNTREPAYFEVTFNGATFTVHLEPRVPFNQKDPMVVDRIEYEQEFTPENAKAITRKALEKYGQPSNGTLGAVYEWCRRPNSNPGVGCHEYIYDPKLSLSLGTGKLELSDGRYRQAVTDFMTKSRNSKPVF